jgi:hypothetical protein
MLKKLREWMNLDFALVDIDGMRKWKNKVEEFVDQEEEKETAAETFSTCTDCGKSIGSGCGYDICADCLYLRELKANETVDTNFYRWRRFRGQTLANIAEEMNLLSAKHWSVEDVHEVEMGERKITAEEADMFCGILAPPIEMLFPEGLKEEPVFTPLEISKYVFSTRAYNCLINMGITELSQLESKTEADLLEQKHLGKTTLEEIRLVMESQGMTLSKEK